MHVKKPFILYITDKKLPKKVYYVRYTEDRVILSTHETELSKEQKFAIEYLEDHSIGSIEASKNRDEFHKLLQEYYTENSPHIEYCNKHGRSTPEKSARIYHKMMSRICELPPDVHKFIELTKQRLIRLQTELLNQNLTVKTVKNNFIALARIYKELLDNDIVELIHSEMSPSKK